MRLAQCRNELQNFLLENKLRDCHVVVMPDFFLDRLINLLWNVEEFSRLVSGVASRKGGSLDGVSQTDMKGGNAINVASALASLGVKVTPIICTSELGLQQIKYHFRNTPVNMSHVKTCGKASITTALEFQHRNQKTNVMLRDLGSLAEFGPSNLNQDDYALFETADYLCLFNWAGTLKFGTSLAEAVFGNAKSRGCKTFFDTADPTPNAKEIQTLLSRVLKGDYVDILSLNENEAVTYAGFLDENFKAKQGRLANAESAMEAARILTMHLHARIDLHTSVFSATLRDNKEVVVPSFNVKILRATGAGDAWNAGNLFGDHNGLSDECRLTLANAVSACYLSSEDGTHPSKEKLAAFLKANS
jgi:ribokinase